MIKVMEKMRTPMGCLQTLISILFFAKFSTENLINCGNCRNDASTLICPHYNETKYTIHLEKHDNEKNKFLQIDCHNLPILDFSHLEGCVFASVEAVKLRYCPFFTESFADIFGQIGIEPSKVRLLAVYFSMDGVTTFSSNHLEKLTNLAELSLENTQLTSLSKDSFLHFPQLQRLRIKGNRLADIHPNIFNSLLDLKLLVMNGNGLNELPETLLQNLESLEIVSFASNMLEHVPGNLLEELSSLKRLNFYGNRLSTIPENFLTNNTKIENLRFSRNELTYLPEELFKTNTLLATIELDQNLITTLPQYLFRNSINIRSIILSFNKINSLPERIFDSLTLLQVIELDNNNLVALPDKIFRYCYSLKYLNLSKNSLQTLKFSQFSFTPTLIEIDLSHNLLTSEGVIDENDIFALNRQNNLEDINLSYNELYSFDVFAWSNFVKLKYLKFEGNYLVQMDFKEIFALPNFSVVSLANNKLEKIEGSIPAVHKTVNIYLSGNNFTCDCHNIDLVKQIQNFGKGETYRKSETVLNVLDKSELICQRPEKHFNLKMLSMRLSDLECFLPDSKCSNTCPCVLNQYYKNITIKCAHANLTSVPDVKYLPNFIYTLDLSTNNLSTFDLSTDTQIIMLNLSNNHLRSENFKTVRNLPMNLSVLDLSGNELTTLTSSFLSELSSTNSLNEISLSSNPWICDCDINPLIDFIQANVKKIKNIRSIKCQKEQTPLIDLTDEDTCPITKRPKILAIIGGAAVFLFLIAVIGTASLYHYWTSIKIWLFTHRICLWLISEEEIDADKSYDAFISYSHQDEEFVMKELLQGLENGDPKYQICLHCRDWVVGEFIQNQIMNSVHNSRRTIVVLSKNFLESVWGQMEFKAAHQQALQDKTNRVLVIVYGEMPPNESLDEELQHYISMHTYLKWGQPKFWESLRYAMPHPQNHNFWGKQVIKNVHLENPEERKLKGEVDMES